ncbi:ASCH domain-containing protein [Methylobacterium gnaphalii]|nr:ASCH domain-containing protein [Methylobacterium gnaphalii]GJD69457.1 hypothetical protein MMMDOFMJ_2388 [Methylobacterium gnaphalii]
MRPLRALSIRQPWAWAIVALGKDIENRKWRTHHRGRTLIHAGKGLKSQDLEDFLGLAEAEPAIMARLTAAGGLPMDHLREQCGGIVGAVEIRDCVTHSDSPWFVGRFGFVLANAEPLPFRPCPGQLGFFTPADGSMPAPAPRPAIEPEPDLFSHPRHA